MLRIVFILFFSLLIHLNAFAYANKLLVHDKTELKQAIQKIQAGDEIVLADGVWKNVQIFFSGIGTKDEPIILRAETPGKVFIEGQSFIKLGGKYLIVKDLHFKNGYTPSNAIIEFRIDENSIANYSTVTNCVIEDFVQPNRYNPDHWVEFWGRHNQLDHCYIAGKFNQGPTIRINLQGNEHIRNYHQIVYNYFGPRPRKGGPKAETIQIGDSYTSMTPSFLSVSNNYFDRCNGEVEVVSNKSNFNEFRNNIFFKCEGSLVLRHGNYCKVDGNIFIGDENSMFNGGIRVINTGHWITNNYFYAIKGDEFRSPLAIMNGIPKSPLNRYNQVTDVVVAYNTWVDCKSPWQFSVGANMNKKDVLPKSEIRSARPIRTILANNIIYNNNADNEPLKLYDKVDGITFKNNLIDNQKVKFKAENNITTAHITMAKINNWLYTPSSKNNETLKKVYSGFGFEDIQSDLFNHSRTDKNRIGAIINFDKKTDSPGLKKNYGPDWYSKVKPTISKNRISVNPKNGDLLTHIKHALNGDILELDEGVYLFDQSLVIKKNITLQSKDQTKKAKLVYSGSKNTPAFEMNPRGKLILNNILLEGSGSQYAFASLKDHMFFSYNLEISGSSISNFNGILKTYKGSFADTIVFKNTDFKNCLQGIELSAEIDDKGDYNAEFVQIESCTFTNIQKNVINYYRGGYDESTIGGNLNVTKTLFENCADKEDSEILIKTRGIINVDLSDNTFKNNPIKLIALLWGEKNNHHHNNNIANSGAIRVDKYLKQKLVY